VLEWEPTGERVAAARKPPERVDAALEPLEVVARMVEVAGCGPNRPVTVAPDSIAGSLSRLEELLVVQGVKVVEEVLVVHRPVAKVEARRWLASRSGSSAPLRTRNCSALLDHQTMPFQAWGRDKT
jgi:hypothetical protein